MSWPIQKGLASMRTSRREFLQTSALASLAAAHSTSASSDSRTNGNSTDEHLNASEIARKHMIVRDTPSSSFFEGMLLGNGDVGAWQPRCLTRFCSPQSLVPVLRQSVK